ncbi:SMI1/KNR4 family protein [Carnobacterium gallinarum]|uniref:SMI1/KNR4 family protein n=1 Tax=Carnobacterium gallinarum TaxID=2749 RepID=UPI00055550B4|nr:SMI1/KNR4 family protein [Carnobacterium gallinarum]
MYFIKNKLFPTPNQLYSELPFFQKISIADLPNSYLALLTEQNGGYLRLNSLPTSEPTRDGLDSVEFHYLFGLHSESATSILFQQDDHDKFSLPDYFIFFSVNGDQLWAFDYSNLKNNEPSIRYIDMDTDQWLHIADSFEEFLYLLHSAPLDLNEERTLTRHEANHNFLLATSAELESLLLRFEDDLDKNWYFTWLLQLAQSNNQQLQHLAFSAFETQVLYFHPVLPKNTRELARVFESLAPSVIDTSELQQVLKELR